MKRRYMVSKKLRSWTKKSERRSPAAGVEPGVAIGDSIFMECFWFVSGEVVGLLDGCESGGWMEIDGLGGRRLQFRVELSDWKEGGNLEDNVRSSSVKRYGCSLEQIDSNFEFAPKRPEIQYFVLLRLALGLGSKSIRG